MTAVPRCLWCAKQFPPRTVGGHEKKFCSGDCKNSSHSGLRRWAQRAIDLGQVSISDLKSTRAVVHDAGNGRSDG